MLDEIMPEMNFDDPEVMRQAQDDLKKQKAKEYHDYINSLQQSPAGYSDMGNLLTPERDLSKEVLNAVAKSQQVNPNSPEIQNEVAMRRILSAGAGGSKIPIYMPGGLRIDTYRPEERARADKMAMEPYERALKQNELNNDNLRRLTQAQNILDLQGARKSQHIKRIEDVKRMNDELRMKKDAINPSSFESKSAVETFQKDIADAADRYSKSNHPALRRLVSQLDGMVAASSGKSKAEIEKMAKSAQASIDDARQEAGLDVTKYVGERNASAAAMNAATNRYRADTDADYKEFLKWKEAQEQKNKAEKSTADEKKAKMYLGAADEAEKSIEEAGKEHDPTSRFNFDRIPDALRTEERNAYEDAALAWLNNINYLRSGAAMGEKESARARKEFFPIAGDSKEQIQKKAERRKKFIENTKEAYGIKGQKKTEYTPTQEEGISNLIKSTQMSREDAINFLKKNNKL